MLDHDLDDFDPAAARKALADGGNVPPGKYHVRLDGAKVTTTGGGLSFDELTFTVVEGRYAGAEFGAKLWHSDKPANHTRAKIVKHALGMMHQNPDGKGYLPTEGRETFAESLGCECVAEAEHEVFTGKSGKPQTKTVATFAGFWSVTDPEVKGVKKAAATAKPAVSTARQKVDTSDI